MKPKSIRVFNRLYPVAVILALLSAALGFSALERQARAGLEGAAAAGDSTIGIGMVIAALLIFVLLAIVLWTTLALMRMGWMRYVLALIAAYSVYRGLFALGVTGPTAGTVLDLLAALVAALAAAVLFRPDARAWFAENTDADEAP